MTPLPRPTRTWLLAALLAVGVAPPAAQTGTSSGAAVPTTLVTATPDGYTPSVDPAARYAAFEARAAMRRAVRYAIGQAGTWQEARRDAEHAMAAHPDAPDFETEQYVATLMLETHLLPGSPETDPARLDAIGDYTEALIRHRNPNADLLDRALGTLERHWAPDRSERAARGAFAAAERYVEIKADCDGCGLDAVRTSAARLSGQDAMVQSIQRAMDGAEALRARF